MDYLNISIFLILLAFGALFSVLEIPKPERRVFYAVFGYLSVISAIVFLIVTLTYLLGVMSQTISTSNGIHHGYTSIINSFIACLIAILLNSVVLFSLRQGSVDIRLSVFLLSWALVLSVFISGNGNLMESGCGPYCRINSLSYVSFPFLPPWDIWGMYSASCSNYADYMFGTQVPFWIAWLGIPWFVVHSISNLQTSTKIKALTAASWVIFATLMLGAHWYIAFTYVGRNCDSCPSPASAIFAFDDYKAVWLMLWIFIPVVTLAAFSRKTSQKNLLSRGNFPQNPPI